MIIPFTTDQFLSVFAEYNRGAWPAQLVLAALAVVSIALAWWPARSSRHLVMGVVALLWTWMGAVYHLIYFSTIKPAAYLFGLDSALAG